MNETVFEIVLHAITAVGIIQWAKQIIRAEHTSVYAWALPLISVAVAFSTLWEPALLALRVWAWAQLAYPFLVQLPERLIKGGSDAS